MIKLILTVLCLSLGINVENSCYAVDQSSPTLTQEAIFEEECQRIAAYLNNYFAYSEEDLDGGTINETTNTPCAGTETCEIAKQLKNGEKKKIITFLKYKDSQIKDKYIHVFTIGNGLCYFNAIGQRNYPYFEHLAGFRVLSNLIDCYAKRGEEIDLLLTEQPGKVEEIIKSASTLKDSDKARLLSVLKRAVHIAGLLKEFMKELKLPESVYYGLMENNELNQAAVAAKTSLDKVSGFFKGLKPDDFGNAARLMLDTDDDSMLIACAVELLKEILLTITKLKTSQFWFGPATAVPAYINFSEHFGDIAVFYDNAIQDRYDIFPLNKWVKFSGKNTRFNDPTKNTQASYKQIFDAAGASNDFVVDGEEVLRLTECTDQEVESAKHHISIDSAHASRIIPLKYYRRVKEILAGNPDIMVFELEH
ncbi:MAG: hypothetical protein LBB12_02070 [Holosporaceae bacterium]|nr:hypothetical protein [Holosporaceae bacterium]